jgi:hypothetical protein
VKRICLIKKSNDTKSLIHSRFSLASWIGLSWGILVGLTPFGQPIGLHAQITLGLGLGLTYLSIGVLLDWLSLPPWVRNFPTKLAWGALAGVLYSLPGAIFTMTPYPLAADAPDYFREFTAGGWRAFFLTLLFGGVVGLTCIWGRKR